MDIIHRPQWVQNNLFFNHAGVSWPDTVMLSAKFENDFTTEMDVLDEWVFGGKSYIATSPWFASDALHRISFLDSARNLSVPVPSRRLANIY